MSNMSYCKFRNTERDFDDCVSTLEAMLHADAAPLDADELSAAKDMIGRALDLVVILASRAGCELDELDEPTQGGASTLMLDTLDAMQAEREREAQCESVGAAVFEKWLTKAGIPFERGPQADAVDDAEPVNNTCLCELRCWPELSTAQRATIVHALQRFSTDGPMPTLENLSDWTVPHVVKCLRADGETALADHIAGSLGVDDDVPSVTTARRWLAESEAARELRVRVVAHLRGTHEPGPVVDEMDIAAAMACRCSDCTAWLGSLVKVTP